MKNSRSERETELLADLFHENWDTGKAVYYARQAAVLVRRRRLVKTSLAATALVTLLAALFWPVVRERSIPRERMAKDPAPVQRNYEIITTDQLLNQLRDRPILVVKEGRAGKKVILLGQK